MKRSIFLKVMAGALVLPALGAVSSTPTAQALAAATPTTADALEYLALDVAIKALNEFGPQFITPPDDKFWPLVYARLGEAGMDTSWPTAQKVGQRYYQLRDELITRANPLNPTGQK